MKTSKALFITYDGLTDQLGQSQVIPYLLGLSNQGIEMHVLSCEKPTAYSKRKELIGEVLLQGNVKWHPILYHKSPPLFSTLFDIITLRIKCAALQKKYSYKITHCRSYIPALLGLWMKKRYGVKMIFDMRGFWADERVDGKIWSLSNPLFKLIFKYFKKQEKNFLQRSDHVVSLTNNGKNVICSGQMGYSVTTPVKVIPCCVDLSLFNMKSEYQLGKKSPYTISYLGSIGTWYMLDEMLDFFLVLQARIPNAKFLFITQEPKRWVLRRCTERGVGIESITVVPAERKDVPYHLAQSNASVFFIKPVFSKKASSPTKQGEIMAMGIPIICNSGVGDTDYIVEKYNSGVILSSFTNNDYELAINSLLSINFKSKSLVKGAREFYSMDLGVKLYYSIYKELIDTIPIEK